MRRTFFAMMILSVVSLLGLGGGYFTIAAAQDGTSTDTANHPMVGTWIVDTATESDTDSPEVGVFAADGHMLGLGANRVAGGTWEVIDDTSVLLTLVTVFDSGGMGGYVMVHGVHQLDDTGDAWTCDCMFTVVSADGTVLDSGSAPASAVRMPVEDAEMVGTPMAEIPTWTPTMSEEGTPEAE